MKLVKVKKTKKGDVQYEPKTKQQAQAVFNHLQQQYQKFDKHLREMAELVHLIRGADKTARQELAKRMVGMSDSMSPVWAGIVKEFGKL